LTIDINDSIFDIVTNNPDAADALKELGFDKIVNPAKIFRCKRHTNGKNH